eukprot:1144657-Pelagomonas_calceolata.AAC.4
MCLWRRCKAAAGIPHNTSSSSLTTNRPQKQVLTSQKHPALPTQTAYPDRLQKQMLTSQTHPALPTETACGQSAQLGDKRGETSKVIIQLSLSSQPDHIHKCSNHWRAPDHTSLIIDPLMLQARQQKFLPAA